jgi:cobalt-zinc-cadmium efflux system protein
MHGHHHHGHHGHHHDHSHHAEDISAFRWAFVINLVFAIIELVGGVWTNSVAVLSDAIHDFGDAIAVGLAFFLEKKSHGASDLKYSYGYRRWSAMSAVITSIVLLIGSCLIIAESIPRLLNPQTPKVEGMIGLALIGIAANGFAFWKLSKGQSLSKRALSLHFIEDILGWVIVLIGAIVMLFFPIPILDSVLGLMLSVWVGWNAFKGLRITLRVFLQGTPEESSVEQIEKEILSLPEIQGIHHIHYWTLDGEKHIFTSHLALKNNLTLSETIQLKERIKNLLRQKFNIFEATLELEWEKDFCSDPEHD